MTLEYPTKIFLTKSIHFYWTGDFKVVAFINGIDRVLNKAIRINFTFVNKLACEYEVNQDLK